jgi:hypothetical protein
MTEECELEGEAGHGEPTAARDDRMPASPPGVLAVRFVGIHTELFDEMVAVYRDALELEPFHEAPGAAWFRLGDQAQVHVYGPPDVDHSFFGTSPCIGFEVADFEAARAALLGAGCVFIGVPQVAGSTIWNHYQAPDGNVYEIVGRVVG